MNRQVRTIFLLTIVVVVLGVCSIVLQQPKSDGLAHVYMLDIGQGDSFLIQAANGRQMLIDGGRDARVLTELSKVMPRGDRTIDVVIATHPDADHAGGLPLVLDRYKVGLFVTSEVYSDTKVYKTLVDKLIAHDIPAYYARHGMEIGLDTTNPASFSILFPDRSTYWWETNPASIVGRLDVGTARMLFTADSTIAIEDFLTQAVPHAIDVDILKIGHHGSKTSTGEAFLRATSPTLALISAGVDNSYGHPHPMVTGRLTTLGIPWLSTQDQGTVELTSNGAVWYHK